MTESGRETSHPMLDCSQVQEREGYVEETAQQCKNGSARSSGSPWAKVNHQKSGLSGACLNIPATLKNWLDAVGGT